MNECLLFMFKCDFQESKFMPLMQMLNEHLSKILFNPLVNEWTSNVKSVQRTFVKVGIEIVLKINNMVGFLG